MERSSSFSGYVLSMCVVTFMDKKYPFGSLRANVAFNLSIGSWGTSRDSRIKNFMFTFLSAFIWISVTGRF